jgi:hypothetical protein
MTDTDRLDRLRRHFHTGETPIARPDCLDAETVAALADGSLPANARPEALRHLATCAFCRRAVASVAEALVDQPVTHEIEIVEGRTNRWRRVLRIAVPLAAAATVLVLLWSPSNDSGVPHRGGPLQGSAPTPIGPRGTVESAPRLQWTSVAGSERYRVTLFGAQGNVLYESEIADTVVTLPDSVRLLSGRPYLWKVEARTGWDRWVTSDLVDFTIARAPPQ